MSFLVSKYGSTAMVAGASEGLGASFSEALAQQGFNLVLVARRIEPLELFAEQLRQQYKIKVTPIACDLADTTALATITRSIGDQSIDFLVYNACIS